MIFLIVTGFIVFDDFENYVFSVLPKKSDTTVLSTQRRIGECAVIASPASLIPRFATLIAHTIDQKGLANGDFDLTHPRLLSYSA